MKILQTLYINQWLILAIVIPFLAWTNLPTLDIAVHDTYFVTDGATVAVLLFFLTALFWAIFRFIKASRTLRWLMHIQVIGFSFLAVLTTILAFSYPSVQPRRYYDYSVYDEFNSASSNLFSTIFSDLDLSTLIFITLTFPIIIFIIQWLVAFVKFIRHKKSGL